MRRPVAALALLWGSASAAFAQTSAAADSTPSGATQRPLWELGVGIAGLRLPDYRGSDQERSYLLPVPYVVYRGTWLRADRDGARALLLNTERVKVDVSVAASVPTRSEDNEARQGMPNLPATGEIGPNLNLTLYRSTDRGLKLDLRLPLRGAITFERSPEFIGMTFSPNLNLDFTDVPNDWNVGVLTGPLFATRRYHEHFYSVDPLYASAVRPAYQAHGGYAGWQVLAATSRRFNNLWVGAFVRYDSLAGAVFADSPLVRSKSALTAGFAVSWVLARSAELVTARDE